MSQLEKALLRLTSLPKNYRWEEAVSLLAKLGYAKDTNDGSRVKFYRESDKAMIILHRPPPESTLKTYAVRCIYQKLLEGGDLNG